jgi:hypothetical protein
MTEPINPLDDETRDLSFCENGHCVIVYQLDGKWFVQRFFKTDLTENSTLLPLIGPYDSRKEAWKAFTEKIQNE